VFIVKEKKSILEKFGLIEKVTVASTSENDFTKTEEAVVYVEPQKVFDEKVSNVEVKTEVKRISVPEDLFVGMKNKKLFRLEEIYRNYNVESQGINSLFIIESFLKALPDYLPVDVKRDSTLNIVSSSGVKIESLIKDGNGKLKCLKEFSQSFSDDASDSISKCENEIRKLNEKINNYKKIIDDMKKLEEEQNAVVKYEVQRINNILEFINPEK
jgi:hypothetical protein